MTFEHIIQNNINKIHNLSSQNNCILQTHT